MALIISFLIFGTSALWLILMQVSLTGKGKTTTSEQMLYVCGELKRVGRVDSGDTVMDFLPQERERGITISSAAITFPWKNYSINLIDTPGHVDFTIEVERSVRVLDGAVIVLDAVSGVQAQTKTVWRQVCKQKIPAIAFINKMDRDGADFNRSLKSIRSSLGGNVLPIQLPIVHGDKFFGIVDLISMTKIVWSDDQYCVGNSRTPPPPTVSAIESHDCLYGTSNAARQEMLEIIAENDDIFFELFVNSTGSVISESDIVKAIRRLCLNNVLIPTLCGSALKGKGVEPLLNSVVSFLPSPIDRPHQTAVLTSKNKNDIDKKKNELLVRSDMEELCALAFKITFDKERGPLVFVRVFSGILVNKQVIRNSTRNVKERINQLLQISADDMANIDEIYAGQVGCIVGLKDTRTGDTIVNDKSSLHHYMLKGLTIPPPVFSISIEPEKASDLKELMEILSILSLEDPSLVVELNKESNQILLRGIGELHLEIVCDKIRRNHNMEICTGRSYIAYRETIMSTADVGPIQKSIFYNKTIGVKRMYASVEFEVESSGYGLDATMEIPEAVKKALTADEYVGLLDGLQSAFIRGPLGFPVVGLHVRVISVTRDMDTTPGAIRACAAMLVDTVLRGPHRLVIEPIMCAEITLPVQKVGDVVSDLTVTRRAVIKDVETVGPSNIVYADVPLGTMLGYATTIRSITRGEGSFSLEYSHHAPVDIDDVNI